MKKLFFAWATMLVGHSVLAQNTDNLLNNYISVKNALITGDNKTALQAANTLYQSVKSEGSFAQKGDLLSATEKLSKAGSIEKQRAVFNEVSTIMWTLIKAAPKVNHEVYYQYCPMKKSYWLSNEKTIKNPYYGSSMLTCGKVIETKE